MDLLNQKLVLFWSEIDREWKCLDDRCSHRFAPLSEGRVANSCLECAYHGWSFNGDGKCQGVPQAKAGSTGRQVQGYPVRLVNTMLFVWADPVSYESIGKLIAIPTLPVLEKSIESFGDSLCFMRDLPYGYELLGENLLDLSHLPFSHHGVGGLKRDLGVELKFKMLSTSQKSPDAPLYEAELENAATSDPIWLGFSRPIPSEARLNLGFYDPCHVRYTRQTVPGDDSQNSYVILYLCPTAANASRVFLFNVSPFLFPPSPVRGGWKARLQSWTSPAAIKKRLISAITARKFTPLHAHMISHSIFDGDGIFLHKQGDRMQRASLTYKDYDTPSSADVMVNAFRRFANAAGQKTRSVGLDTLAEAIAPTTGYQDNLPRSQMLDRYESHTKHCPICLAGLRQARNKKRRLEILRTALVGALGASSMTLLGAMASLLLWSPASVKGPATVTKVAAAALACSLGGSLSISRGKRQAQAEIDRFYFEDYIHADKN